MVSLKGIKNIVFDFGGVLVDLDPQACLDAFDALGLPQVREYLTPYGHKGPFGKVENGDITIEEFHKEIMDLFKISLTDKQIDDAWSAFLVHIPVYKMRMVRELSEKYRVFLLSNTNPVHIRKLKEFEDNGYIIKECFEKLYLSYEIGLSKPDIAIYEYVLNDAGLLPEETLLVDDGPANCRAAESLGIRTYRPEPFEDFSSELLRPDACVATMGFFDGVHEGHRFLIEDTKRIAAEKGLPSMIISFWPHPRTVLHSDFCPQLLTSREEKIKLLEETGVDYIYTLTFDTKLAGLSARDFMETVLKDELNVSCLVIGFDHRFGNHRLDGFDEYRKYGESMGIEVIQSKPLLFSEIRHDEALTDVRDEKSTVSSSLIRRLILSGKMQEANSALGYPYNIKGVVISGHRIGRALGFPTANLKITDPCKLIPVNGVYAVWVVVDGQRYKGMMNIGRRPTLSTDSDISIEVNLLDFSGDLYGKELTVSVMQRFRKEEHFPDVDALVARLHKDKEYVDAFL